MHVDFHQDILYDGAQVNFFTTDEATTHASFRCALTPPIQLASMPHIADMLRSRRCSRDRAGGALALSMVSL
jgi:hypothetical protein